MFIVVLSSFLSVIVFLFFAAIIQIKDHFLFNHQLLLPVSASGSCSSTQSAHPSMTNIAHSLCVKLTTDTLCTFCYTIWTPCFSYIYNLLPFCITVLTDLFLISVTDLNVYIVYMLIRCSVSCSEVQILLFILLWVFICWLWWSNIYISIYYWCFYSKSTTASQLPFITTHPLRGGPGIKAPFCIWLNAAVTILSIHHLYCTTSILQIISVWALRDTWLIQII